MVTLHELMAVLDTCTEAQQQLNTPRTGKIRALQESAALFSILQANGIQSMQQLHEKNADMNSRYYDLRGKIVKAGRRIAILTERGEMWEQFERRHSRELILHDAKRPVSERTERQRRGNHPKAWRLGNRPADRRKADGHACHEIHAGGFESSGTVPQNRQRLSRQERDKPHDREPDR